MLRNAFPFKDNSNYETDNLRINTTESNTGIKKRKKKKESNDDSFCSLTPKINLDE